MILVMTHAVERTDRRLVGIMLVARNLGYLSARYSRQSRYSRKLAALGRLSAGVAHEVKNPLNAMMIHPELLGTKIQARGPVPASPWRGNRRGRAQRRLRRGARYQQRLRTST